MTLNRQGRRLVLHLSNHHGGDPNRLSLGDTLLSIAGVEVTLDHMAAGLDTVTRVSLAPSDAAVMFEPGPDGIRFTVPAFTIHAIIVIE